LVGLVVVDVKTNMLSLAIIDVKKNIANESAVWSAIGHFGQEVSKIVRMWVISDSPMATN
jgi:hypothetical protein